MSRLKFLSYTKNAIESIKLANITAIEVNFLDSTVILEVIHHVLLQYSLNISFNNVVIESKFTPVAVLLANFTN